MLILNENKLISEFISKSKLKATISIVEGSKILTNENVDNIKFLRQCFPDVKRFQLLFRASDHNFEAAKFHQNCDKIPNTLTIAKTEFGKIIGGFTTLEWEAT